MRRVRSAGPRARWSTVTGGRRQRSGSPGLLLARALRAAEQAGVLGVLCVARFADRTPAEVDATLLDETTYLSSDWTVYRILAEDQAVRERRAQPGHPNHPKPRWWPAHPTSCGRETSPASGTREVAVPLLLRDPGHLQSLRHGQDGGGAGDRWSGRAPSRGDIPQARCDALGLTLHSDRRAPMTAECTAQLLADLGVTESRGRPWASNDSLTRRHSARPSSTTRASRDGSAASEGPLPGVLRVVQ